MQNHQYDPIGRLVGGNPATGGTIPEGSNPIKEVTNAFGGEITVHNCYGKSTNPNCANLWNSGFPELRPIKNYPAIK